jgi:histidinol-phosphate aminotransferase
MQRKLVKVSNAVLDLEPRQFSQEASLEMGRSLSSRSDTKDSPLPPSPGVLRALNDYIAGNSLDRYPNQEALELRERLSQYTSLPKENISCFGGSDVALEHIARTYLEPGVEAVMACADNADFRAIAQSTGATIVDIHQDDPFDIQIESVINQIGPRTRLVYLSNPDNLTGTAFSEPEIVFLLAYAERSMVVIDESYFEFSGRTVADLVRRFPNLIVVRSFSKAFGLASLRVGYILSDPDNLEFVNRLKITKNLSGLGRVAALAALEDMDFTNHYVDLINQSKKTLFQSLPEIGYEFKITSANFFLIRVSDPEVAVQRLLAADFRVRDFSKLPELTGYLQITIGIPEETDRLLLSLSRLAHELSTGMNRISQRPSIDRLNTRVEIGAGAR